jgi:hypothetical protein
MRSKCCEEYLGLRDRENKRMENYKNEELHSLFTKYYEFYQIEEDEMCETCSTHGEMRSLYEVLLRKNEGKTSLGRPRPSR